MVFFTDKLCEINKFSLSNLVEILILIVQIDFDLTVLSHVLPIVRVFEKLNNFSKECLCAIFVDWIKLGDALFVRQLKNISFRLLRWVVLEELVLGHLDLDFPLHFLFYLLCC